MLYPIVKIALFRFGQRNVVSLLTHFMAKHLNLPESVKKFTGVNVVPPSRFIQLPSLYDWCIKHVGFAL